MTRNQPLTVHLDHFRLEEQANGRWEGHATVFWRGAQREIAISMAPHVFKDVSLVFQQKASIAEHARKRQEFEKEARMRSAKVSSTVRTIERSLEA
jgi:hypothetical protein